MWTCAGTPLGCGDEGSGLVPPSVVASATRPGLMDIEVTSDRGGAYIGRYTYLSICDIVLNECPVCSLSCPTVCELE